MAITFDGAPSAAALGNYGQRLIPLLSPNAQQVAATQQPRQLTNDEMIQAAIDMEHEDPDRLLERNVLYAMPTKGRIYDPRDKGSIYKRPFIPNDDGTISTMISNIIGSDEDGWHVVSGVTPDGKILPQGKVEDRYYNVGDTGLATFDTLENAEAFDRALHPREYMRLKYKDDPKALAQYEYDLQRADHPEWFDSNGNYTGYQPDNATKTNTAPATSTETVNQAVSNGAKQAADQHAQTQAVRQGFRQGLLGGVPRQSDATSLFFAQGLLGLKDQWARAYAAGDQQGMTDAAQGAETLRQIAANNGVNLDAYYGGANNTRAQLAAAINAQNDMSYGRLLNSMDSATYYDQVYNNAIANGASRSVAKRYAGQQAAKYQAQRMSDLQLALQNRGISHQGFLNSQGAQILAMMYDENPNGVAQVYNQYFGKPVNLGTWELAETSADNADKRQRGQMTLTEQLNELLGNNNTSNQMKLQDQQINYNMQVAKMQDALERYKTDTQRDMSYHKDDASVTSAQYKGSSSGGGSGGSSSGGVSGATKTELTDVQNAADIFEAAKQSLSNFEGDGNAFDKLDKIKEKTSDPAVRRRIDAMKYALNAYREGVAWNDHGETGGKQNFINYYEAVAHDPENADLVAGLEPLYGVATGK